MRSTIELAWAAGFLEGEGSFLNYGSPSVTAAQVHPEPIERLNRMFPGTVSQRKTHGFSDKTITVWKANSGLSVEIMMTLYTLMSPKRKGEIEVCLDRWKQSRLMKRRGTGKCGRGHSLTPENVYIVQGKYQKCRACRTLRKRNNRALSSGVN